MTVPVTVPVPVTVTVTVPVPVTVTVTVTVQGDLMNEREEEAYYIIKKGKVKGASSLAKQMKITRQWAHKILMSLEEQKLIKYEPARWRIK